MNELTNHGLTQEEQEILDKVVDAYNLFCGIEKQHPEESNMFTGAVNQIQAMFALRIARRTYPEGWPTIKQKEDFNG